MKPIQPHETELTGSWIIEGGRACGDATCERIQWLTQNYLIQVDHSRAGGRWETLYRDPADGRLWERTYPQSEMHGGGPPRLVLLESEQVAKKYGAITVQNSSTP